MQFNRTDTFRERLDVGETKFHEERTAGRIPPPDAWLGPRSPVWTDETVEKTMRAYMAAPRPIETRPLRRRRYGNV